MLATLRIATKVDLFTELRLINNIESLFNKGNSMDNVIPFPKNNKIPANHDEVDEKIQQIKHHHINETLTTIIPMLFSYLASAGFEFDNMDEIEDEDEIENDPNIKDAAFLVEAIRSLLCKHHSMDHPFQQIAENVFEPDSTNEGIFSLAKKLNITFKNLEKGSS